MMLSAVSRVTRGRQIGADVRIEGVSIDSRTLQPGAMFVALGGPNFDGHDYVETARERGAVCAMVAREMEVELPQLVVPQPRRALGEMAAWWRSCHDMPLVAVTGSNGKTTVKEMLAAIFGQVSAHVLATEGNLNNDLGVPLTLMRLNDSHDYAVVEMGMNNPGELDYLTGLARPDIAVITNAAAAHLAGLGDLEAVARAKSEILNGLDADGVAVLNADDAWFPLWQQQAGARQVLSFALDAGADVTADFETGPEASRVTLRTPWGEAGCMLTVPGRHNVANALAATAAAGAAGVAIERIAAGLSAWQGVAGRMQRHVTGRVSIINDAYNANPGSTRAAIELLAGCEGMKILVLGDMLELGDAAVTLHEQAGLQARNAGIDGLYGHGDLAAAACRAYGPGAWHFDDLDELVAALLHQIEDSGGPVTVLVKGSRSMRMERVIERLVAACREDASC